MSAGTHQRTGWLVAAVLTTAVFRLWLTASIPSTAIRAPLDDLFFIHAAEHLLAGNWLGPYNETTLIKGVGYPLFLALSHHLGIPKRLAEDGLLILAAGVLAWGLRRAGVSRVAVLVVFVCCTLGPSTYSLHMFRSVREGIYGSQVLLLLGLATALLQPNSWRFRVPVALGLGGVLAWFWQTRPESSWIVPTLVLILGASIWNMWRRGAGARHVLGLAVIVAVLPVTITWGVDQLVRQTNERFYGAPVRTELEDPDFLAAVAAIQRVAQGEWQRFEPLSTRARERLYDESAAFRSLRPWLAVGKDPRRLSFMQTGPEQERKLWFLVWTMRRAAAAAGHHRSLRAAKAFYRDLANEINDACDRGAVPAGPPRRVPAPLLHPSLYWQLMGVWGRRVADMWRLDFPTAAIVPVSALEQRTSGPDSELVARYRRVLREPTEVAEISPTLAKRLAILGSVGGVFAAVVPWLALAGAIAAVLQLVLRPYRLTGTHLPIQLALVTAIAIRTGMVAVIATYCWSTTNVYALSVYPLLPVASVIAIDAGVRLLAARRRLESP